MNTRSLSVCLLLACVLPPLPGARGQVYEKVFSFADRRIADLQNSFSKGRSPDTSLVEGRDGFFYGTTNSGGTSDNNGTIFRMSASGTAITLVEFTYDGSENAGAFPEGALVQAGDGNFYGTTRYGGIYGEGTVFKMTSAGILTTLVNFSGGSDGSEPRARLAVGPDGNLYGTTAAGDGTVFVMSPAGSLITLVTFTGNSGPNRGSSPRAGLTLGSDGNFYGTTSGGGAFGYGTIFQLTVEGVLTTLVDFTGDGASDKGANPDGELIEGPGGVFYGSTYDGGAAGDGTVFKMTSTGVLTTLAEFDRSGAEPSGFGPIGRLVLSGDGDLYGVTEFSEVAAGTVFKVTPAGALTTLIRFTGDVGEARGSRPVDGMILGSDGSLYGTTHNGGAYSAGTVFRMSTAGEVKTLVDFTYHGVTDVGSVPVSGLTPGDDGALYGTTYAGGLHEVGTVYKLTPAGQLTTLKTFKRDDPDGDFPSTRLVKASDGYYYGTTSDSPPNGYGTIFQLTPAGQFRTLVTFTGSAGPAKGDYCQDGLIEGADHNLYGMTSGGGSTGFGTIFKMTPDGEVTTLVEFTDNGLTNKGSAPHGALVLGSNGDFYGTTTSGGSLGYGTIFRMTSAGVLTTLVEFTGSSGSFRGAAPWAALVEGANGTFYGTTQGNDYGTIFMVTAGGAFTNLVNFTSNGPGDLGAYPSAGLVQASDGNFYGTTPYGGDYDLGTIFRMTPTGELTTVFAFVPDPVEARPVGTLAIGEDGNLYGAASNGPGNPLEDSNIFRVLLPGAPSVYVVGLSGQSTTSATIKAQVNARGAATTVSLEYGTDGTTFSSLGSIGAPLIGYQTALVGASIPSLVPGTTYYYRFRGVSSAGTTVSPVASFSTLIAPLATTSAATHITSTSAQFNGTVNARNYDTDVVFEWGTDGNNFPTIAPADMPTVAGNVARAVAASVAGFPAGDIIYYRIRATNAAGTVISGVSSFSTVNATTTAPTSGDVGVTEVTLRASVNTYGRTALVSFRYWADATPDEIHETAAQTVVTNTSTEVTAHVSDLVPNAKYNYVVSVEIAGVVTEGSLATLTTQQNLPPIAVSDVVFYADSVTFDPLANDIDENNVPPRLPNADLSVKEIVTEPQVARGVVTIVKDQAGNGKFIGYTPQFNVLVDDSLIYRIVDPQGATGDGVVRLVSFAKRAGSYGVTLGSSGTMVVEFNGTGHITVGNISWKATANDQVGVYRLKGVFDSTGSLRIPLTLRGIDAGTLEIALQIDPDSSRLTGSVTERDKNGAITVNLDPITLQQNAGTGGLAEAGLRTAFLDAPELSDQVGAGYLLLNVSKNGRRARLAGRLPDGQRFAAGSNAAGTIFPLLTKVSPGGTLVGNVRLVHMGGSDAGMMGTLAWKRAADSRLRGGVDTTLEMHGVEYPLVGRNSLPPIGLGSGAPNARLIVTSRDFADSLEFPLVIGTGGVSGFDQNALKLKLKPAAAIFSGRFRDPSTGRFVPFDGAFRTEYDTEDGQGRGVFVGRSGAGTVSILPITP